MRFMIGLAAACTIILAAQAAAAAPVVAVADFGYVDSSGEPRDQSSVHAQRLGALQQKIIAVVENSGHYTAEKLACATPPCTADNLDQDQIAAAARKQNADFVVFGGVHKISTLIQFGQVDIMSVASGKAVLSREVQFRGDSDEAWQHASDYIGNLVLTGLQK